MGQAAEVCRFYGIGRLGASAREAGFLLFDQMLRQPDKRSLRLERPPPPPRFPLIRFKESFDAAYPPQGNKAGR